MYTKFCDCHLHSSFSSDSTASPVSIIQAALKLGLYAVCFTDHNDFDYPPEEGSIVFQLDLPAYRDKILSLKQQFSGQIEVLCGVEQGLMASVADRVNTYDTHGLDYIIGSSHLVNGADPYYPEFWNHQDTHTAVLQYYESILENIQACTQFDVYGHLDYIARYVPTGHTPYVEADFREIIDEILQKLIAQGKGIEVNTCGLRSKLNNTNPSAEVLKRYHELGGEILTIGSDAHTPENVGYFFKQLPSLLTASGFRYYTVYRERKPYFIKLNAD